MRHQLGLDILLSQKVGRVTEVQNYFRRQTDDNLTLHHHKPLFKQRPQHHQ